MNRPDHSQVVDVSRKDAASSIVLVCEHASAHIPAELNNLGLTDPARFSHVAWDPGALGVAQAMSEALDAVLVAGCVSRLVYDLNRPPEASDAMPTRSETFEVPGNADLTEAQRKDRIGRYYTPFHAAIAQQIASKPAPVLVTIHSFTPIYFGTPRDVEIGILHDTDSRLADAILATADSGIVRRNEPYGPQDGVTHSLLKHGVSGGHLNVMIEVRNDLIHTEAEQAAMATTLSRWITTALSEVGNARCTG